MNSIKIIVITLLISCTILFAQDSTYQNPIIPDFQVNENDDIGSSDQTSPSIAIGKNGNFAISWNDYNGSEYYDINMRFFTHDGIAFGNYIKVSEKGIPYGLIGYYFPDPISTTALNGNGSCIVTWGTGSEVNAQRFDNSGLKLGNNFKVNEKVGIAKRNSSASIDRNGNFIIAWFDYRNSSDWKYDIYAQRYSKDGSIIGNNFKVNDKEASEVSEWFSPSGSPAVASDDNGNCVITWRGDSSIYAQRILNDGSLADTNFKVNDSDKNGLNPDVSMDGNGSFIITWRSSGIYAQQYSSDGIAKGSNFKVNEDSIYAAFSSPSISMDNDGNFIISWKAGDDLWDENTNIYAQCYSSEGSRIGNNFKIAETSYWAGVNASHETKLWDGRIYNTWTDKRGDGTDYDIWANVLDGNFPTEVKDEQTTESLTNFYLSQNYPNPFNPSTIIKYSIPSSSVISSPNEVSDEKSSEYSKISPSGRNDNVNVMLKIYDILGREVAILVNKKQKPGNYEITWNAGNEPSGVYFYKLQCGEFTQINKMLLIK